MRVALDATPALSGDTGVARYTSKLVECSRAHADLDLVPFGAGRGPSPDFPLRRVPVPLRVVHRAWDLLSWPRAETVTGRIDVVHAVDGVPPPTRRPLVMTVHDVLPLVLPQYYGPRFIRIAQGHADSFRRAAHLVTTCRATADNVAEVTGFPRDRITVAPPGARTAPGRASAESPSQAEPYLLFVGSITPRKGLGVLARAVARLRDCPPIIVAGPDGWQSDVVRREVLESGAGDRFRWVGRVEDDALDALLSDALALCHPSVAEGFGIPCLEAMALGTPVVAADIPSVREMGAGCIALAPPDDPEGLAGVLASVLADEGERRRMAEEGLRRAASYTWEAMTDAIVDTWRTVSGADHSNHR